MSDLDVKVTKLSPVPGDLIVFSAKGRLSAEQVQELRERWETQIKPLIHPDIRALIIDQGMTVEQVDAVTLERLGLKRT